MKLYSASATSDYGTVFYDWQVKAGSWKTAFHRAGMHAQALLSARRKRAKRVAVSLVLVGQIKKKPSTPVESN